MRGQCADASSLPLAALPYRWRQTLNDVTVSVPVPPGTRGKQLDVALRKDSIRVGLKGEPPVIEGSFPKEIKVDDSTWTLGAPAFLPSGQRRATWRLCADPSSTFVAPLSPCRSQTTRAR